MALMLIALVAVALAAMTTGLATAARQSRDQQDQAQLRQLLHAGVQLARANQPGAAQLPESLKERAQLTVETTGNQATVRAAVGKHHGAQVVTVEGGNVTSVRLLD
jgi:type II secretory pathway component PulK